VAVLLIGYGTLRLLARKKKDAPAHLDWSHALLGASIYQVLSMVALPIGWLLTVFMTITGIGALLLTWWKQRFKSP